MSRYLLVLVVFCIQSFWPVNAQECTPTQRTEYEQLLNDWLKTHIDSKEVEIKALQLISACPPIAKGGAVPISVKVAPEQTSLWFETMRVMFLNQGKSFAMIYKLNLRQKTLITSCDIEIGEALQPNCMDSVWKQVKKLSLHKDRSTQFATKLALRRLVAGTVLEEVDWQQPMAVQVGQKVKIHYQQGAIKVEAPGTAMNAAYIGDKVVVLLDGHRRTITARIGNDGEVYID